MPENQRLFIALFPPPALRTALHEIALQRQTCLGGRVMPAANLHLTLAFLGMTPTASMPAILDVLRQASTLDCTLALDTLGTFANGGIVWAGCRHIPDTLNEYAANLRSALAGKAIVFDNKPFCPHITLLRKATVCDAPIEPAIEWQPAAAQLCISRSTADGSVYQVVSSCP
ncbi:MAG: RNA 2',3'-cyclic phosphodiesterase [Formivibrio sp.]|nr:RNA 2',3'-cyclic phosphodiesterase [Formivibrio sp.]